nr:hypothetical protein [Herbidospora galbida]
MAAGEDQPEPVVRDLVVVGGRVHLGTAWVRLDEQGHLGAEDLVPAQQVERLAPGRLGQPGARFAGDAVAGPGVEGGEVGVLDAFLGEVEITGDARRRGEHEGPLVTVRVGDGLLGLVHSVSFTR